MRKIAAVAAIGGCLFLTLRFALIVSIDGCARQTLARHAQTLAKESLLKKAAGPRFFLRGKHVLKILYVKIDTLIECIDRHPGSMPAHSTLQFDLLPKPAFTRSAPHPRGPPAPPASLF